MNLHESLTSFESNALFYVHLPFLHSCGAQFPSTANIEGPGICVLGNPGQNTALKPFPKAGTVTAPREVLSQPTRHGEDSWGMPRWPLRAFLTELCESKAA